MTVVSSFIISYPRLQLVPNKFSADYLAKIIGLSILLGVYIEYFVGNSQTLMLAAELKRAGGPGFSTG